MSFLSEEQIAFYHENGYLCLPRFWDEEEVKSLNTSFDELVAKEDLEKLSKSDAFFTAADEHTRKSNQYFLDSAHQVSVFLESQEAIDDAMHRAEELGVKIENRPLYPINKVGHTLHEDIPEFQKLSCNAKIYQICRDLGLETPSIVQSMFICKSPFSGGAVSAHQDSTFLFTRPVHTCIGLWWALDDCTASNGCLYVVPGSHRTTPLTHRMRLATPEEVSASPSGDCTVYERLSDGAVVSRAEASQFDVDPSRDEAVECPAGSLVILHGEVVHYSAGNASSDSRRAYSIHIVDKHAQEYPADNWLQRPSSKPFRTIASQL